MSQCAMQQRPRSAAEVSPSAAGKRSIREEAAALRAAQAAGAQSPSFGTKAQLDDFFARRRVQALKQAEERWGLVFPEGEPVPVPGHDWEWQIESHGIKTPLLAVPPPASSLSAENLSLPTSPAPITHMTTETGLVSLSPAPSMMTPVCPGAPCKKRVRFAPEDPETVVSMDIIQKIKDAFNRIAEREPTKDDWLDLILEINKQINMLESPATSIQSAPQVRDEDPVTEVEAEAEAEPEVAQPHAFPDTQPAAGKSLTY